MAFLTINGIDVPVANDKAGEQLVEIGERTRAFSGAARMSRQATKREFSFETTPMTLADALAYTGLIQGEGHTWDFATLYSSKGLGPSATVGTVSAGTSPATPKFGNALLLSGGSVASSISYQPGIGSSWTVAYWRTPDGGTTWTHYVKTSAGTVYTNGVATGSATGLTVSAPNLTLSDTAATAVRYDDLIFYPFIVPSTWPALIYGYGAAWPAIPLLTAGGDFMTGGLSAHGDVTAQKIVQCALGGAWVDNAQQLAFTLLEV